MPEVLLRADPGDGNDPLEAAVTLPIIPRKGDEIEVWNPDGGFRNQGGPSGAPVFLRVIQVVLTAYAPERTEVWVRMDGYDAAELERAMRAADAGETP